MKKKNPADATLRNINALKKRLYDLEVWCTKTQRWKHVVEECLDFLGIQISNVPFLASIKNPNPGKQEKCNMAKKKGTKKGTKKGC